MMRKTISTLLCLVTLAIFAEKQPIERYQSIIDRQMFGPLPADFDPAKMPSEVTKSSVSEKELTQEQEKLQSAIHFSVINVTPEGATAVGFTDNSDPKAPVHYYLKVGEVRNGWEVKEADAAKATMTIAKGDVVVSLSLGGNSASSGGNGKAANASAGASRRGLLGGSLRARRMQRERQAQEERAQAAAVAAEKEAERRAQEEAEKAQREAERAEQRQQLLAIQEELKRVRDAKAAAKNDGDGEDGNADN